MSARICITGATGYLGRALCRMLDHSRLLALVRAGGAARLEAGVPYAELDVLDPEPLARVLAPGDTVVHLIGTPHPGPGKAAEFQRVDLASVLACAAAASHARVAHFVYVSVAQPAPVMAAYVEARRAGEAAIGDAGLTATILRPWYVLGPGHRWAYLLLPLYGAAELLPAWRDSARRLGMVTLEQMTRALLAAIGNPPPAGTRRVLDVPGIRAA
jgi:uncharacterized protein YbjT (DUF2867 family)